MTEEQTDSNQIVELGRTARAAHRAEREGGRHIIKPGELADARYAKGSAPSLAARKVLALMIGKAGGDAGQVGRIHKITKKELRGSHSGNERISATLEELMQLKFVMRTISERGREATLTSSVIAWNIEEKSEDGMSIVEWEFSEPALQMFQGSDYYARINKAALLAFRSKYALAIYEIGCLLVARRDPTWTGTIEDLREKLGVPHGTLPNFAQFRRKVLLKAQAEVNQLAHFEFTWKEIVGTGRGRPVVKVQLCFRAKDASSVEDAADELDRPKVGREARRAGTVEQVVEIGSSAASNVVSLPALSEEKFPTGSLHYGASSRISAIAVDYGGGWDRDVIAEAYRKFMGDKLETLSGNKLFNSFEGFCKSFVRNNGRP
ncbi:replication initiation protein [Erythrobacter colymbi]|uniref:replication initiation protein n=1 Tax=Erythrobacter colymbi TaxID=1161202 RepID=UPI000A39381D|nr:replication initiation protein [Erythrobacter colymbi]